MENVYIGIDPGVKGAMAVIMGRKTGTVPLPDTELDMLDMMVNLRINGKIIKGDRGYFCCIEQQTPRPTFFKGTSSVLPSTVKLFGNYVRWRMAIIAAGIPFVEVSPVKWLRHFNLKRLKNEEPNRWKNRLKGKAQQFYPNIKVTMANADALLIATYAKQNY